MCKEAQAYIHQDWVKPQGIERSMEPHFFERNMLPSVWGDLLSNVRLTESEKRLVTLLGYGMNRADMAHLLQIPRKTLRKRLSRLKRKCHEFF
jgi:DNA-binding NtrC family response regulator